MKYVGVKHKPEHTNLYWFAVPDRACPARWRRKRGALRHSQGT